MNSAIEQMLNNYQPKNTSSLHLWSADFFKQITENLIADTDL